jgi:hypothetical protein
MGEFIREFVGETNGILDGNKRRKPYGDQFDIFPEKQNGGNKKKGFLEEFGISEN